MLRTVETQRKIGAPRKVQVAIQRRDLSSIAEQRQFPIRIVKNVFYPFAIFSSFLDNRAEQPAIITRTRKNRIENVTSSCLVDFTKLENIGVYRAHILETKSVRGFSAFLETS